MSPAAAIAGIAVLAVACAFVCAWLTARVLAWAERARLLDHPNERSSHEVPTPRGGGLAVVAVVTVTGVVTGFAADGGARLAAPLAAMLVMAAVGWIDDRVGMSVWPRLVIQLAVGITLVTVPYANAPVDIAGVVVPPGPLALVIWVLWFAWLTNLYNFMDGIDGIAGIEAVCVGAVLAAWFLWMGDLPLAALSAAAAGAAGGFLRLNWAPARIFMGDVGSLALGALFASLAMVAVVEYRVTLGAFVVLLGVFLADATTTLVRRIVKGEDFMQAHRSHFYQRAVRTGLPHAAVSGGVAILNLPLAVLATFELVRQPPRAAWLACAAALLAAAMGIVLIRERRGRGA